VSIKLFLGAAILATSLTAQDPAAEMERLRRSLGNSRAEVERLLDLRIRHDLGMAVVDEVLEPGSSVPMSPDAMAKTQKEIAEQEAVNLTLQERFRRLSAEVDRLRQDATAEASVGSGDRGAIVEVPAVGSAMPRTAQPAAMPSELPPGKPTDYGIGVTNPAAPVAAVGKTASADLGVILAQVEGSEDHFLVGHALYAAARQLIDRAAELRNLGQIEAATELDKSAKDRLERALLELQPVVSVKTPPLPALFCQGRCLELLFRHAERYEGLSIDRSAKEYQQREAEVRSPFLKISELDVQPGTESAKPVPGSWGLAAETVLEHFRWINVHGGYRPRVEIDSLTWSGERR
jgi:hypothetical protein